MKVSAIVATLFAAAAVAGPLEKRVYEYKTVATTTVIKYVTPGEPLPTEKPSYGNHRPKHPHPKPHKPKPQPKPQPQKEAYPAPQPKPEPKPQPKPAEPKPQAPAPVTNGGFEDTILSYHNAYRANHSAEALTWDPEAAKWAKKLADECLYMEHKLYDQPYGQNNYYSKGGDMDPAAGCASWYNSECTNYQGQYGASQPSLSLSDYGHFTQVVWKDTKAVGCATTWCPSIGWHVFVCNYAPAGNVQGRYAENVGKPLNNKPLIP